MMNVPQYIETRDKAIDMARRWGRTHFVIETEYGYQVVATLDRRNAVFACYPDGHTQYFQ